MAEKKASKEHKAHGHFVEACPDFYSLVPLLPLDPHFAQARKIPFVNPRSDYDQPPIYSSIGQGVISLYSRERGVHKLNKVYPQRLPGLRLHLAIAISSVGFLSPVWWVSRLWFSSLLYTLGLRFRS